MHFRFTCHFVNFSFFFSSDQRDAYGNTPLHLACEENRVEEAKLLVTRGADLAITNRERKTPLDLASPGLVRELEEIKREAASK